MIQILQGHTYAIGLSARAVPVGSDVDRATRAQGWSYPNAYQAPALAFGGWAPVVYYAASRAPVAPPVPFTAYEAIAFRSGPSAVVQGYAGEVSVLAPFGPEVLWVLDLQSPASRSFASSPDATPTAPAPADELPLWVTVGGVTLAAAAGIWALIEISNRIERAKARGRRA